MVDHWVITLMGEDQPHLLEALADIVLERQGDWKDSRVAELDGRFVAIISIDVPRSESASMQLAIESYAEQRDLALHLSVTRPPSARHEEKFVVRLTANNRPGLVKTITHKLNQMGLTTEEMSSQCQSAPWGGELLFRAEFVLLCSQASVQQFKKSLESLGDDWMVDIEPLAAPSPARAS
jgi:glycine cleavage system regulatory protein